MTPPINIDGESENYSNVTIDGQTVEQITIDGQEVLSTIPDSGVSRWTLDSGDTESGPTATDVWSNNDATGVGTITTGITGLSTYDSGEAWSLEPGRITTPLTQSFFAGRSAISVGGWIRTTATGIAILSASQRNDSTLLLAAHQGGQANWSLKGVGDIAAGRQNDGNPHHIVGTYDGSTLALYVDGSQVNSTTASGTIVDQDTGTDLNAELAAPTFTEDADRDCDLDDPRVYSKGLTKTEVSNWFNTGSISG